ncbi:MAG: glycosyltransferase [Candidatus Paceibacterota bacterium]|jgi:glycosyltransferase involved in cell wall biosynthesis
MKVALVHDYLVQYGGAERVLEAFTEIFPKAPIFTMVYDRKLMNGAFSDRKIHTSFLQKIPFIGSHHRLFPLLMPMAIEQFDLSGFDIVLSDSNSYAKGAITSPNTLHITYCHTPMRYAWDDCHKYLREFKYSNLTKKLIPFAMNYIRLWDKISADRPDLYIANSNFVASRIRKYYNKTSEVINPPVNMKSFSISEKVGDYYFMVGRALAYKRFDIVIDAFNALGLPLKIMGKGPEMKDLRKRSNDNIEFLGYLEDGEMSKYYSGCKAFIFPSEEDFGITPLEAMASGRPVIAYRGGGALETVIEGKTGLFFDEQTPQAVIDIVNNFDPDTFDPASIREHAGKFDKEMFKDKIRKYIEREYMEFRNNK